MNLLSRTESPDKLLEATELAQIYSELLFDSGREIDRLKVRRIVDVAGADRIEAEQQAWWGWGAEAGRELGLKVKTISCQPEDVLSLARDGAVVIYRSLQDGRFLALTCRNGRTLLLNDPRDDGQFSRTTPATVHKHLDVDPKSGMVSTVVIEPLTKVGAGAKTGKSSNPLYRLFALLRPEMSDIWMIVIFAMVIGVLTMAVPLAIETLVNTVAFGSYRQPVIVLSLILFSFLAFSAALRAVQTYVVEIIQRRLLVRMAADLGYRIPRIQLSKLKGKSSQELVNRFLDIITVQKVSSVLLLDGVTLIMSTTIGMAVLAFYHPWLLGFDVVLLAVIAFIIVVLGRGAIGTSIKESKTKYKLLAWFEELAGCQRTLRFRGGSEFSLDRTDHLSQEYLDARQKHFYIVLRQILFALGMQAVASTALLALGGWLVVSGELTLGQLVAAELIVSMIVGSFAKLGKHMENFYDLMASIDKVGELLDLPMEQSEGISSIPTTEALDIEFNKVTHSGMKSVGPPITLKISQGEHLALTGTDEKGKSVFLEILFGLEQPESGYITVAGIDTREIRLEKLRQEHALVRDIEVFEDTIAENVHLQRRNVTMEVTRFALQQVGLLEAVLALPEGIETKLSATGYPLTPNQLRKLMLARALAGAPACLLIDGLLDSMSDAETESLCRVLFAPSARWTTIVATGRKTIADHVPQQVVFGKQETHSGSTGEGE